MKIKIIPILTVLILTGILFSCAGCAKKLDEPVFLKNLIFSEDMDIDVMYISDKKWDKDIESISIPDVRDDISVSFYDEETEQIDGYVLHTIHFGIGSSELSSDYGLAESLTITEIEVSWDDGTTYTANVGNITIQSLPEDITHAHSVTNEPLDGGMMRNSSELQFEKDVDITGVYIPYESDINKIVADITVNGVSLDEIDKDNPLHVEAGKKCVLSYSGDEENPPPFGKIFVEIMLIGFEDGEEKPVGVCVYTHSGEYSDIKRFLK